MYTASLNSSTISETFFCASMVPDMDNITFSMAYSARYPLTAAHWSAHGLVHSLQVISGFHMEFTKVVCGSCDKHKCICSVPCSYMNEKLYVFVDNTIEDL